MVKLHLMCQCCRENVPSEAVYRYELNEKILTREDKSKPFRPIFFCEKHLGSFQQFAGTIFAV